jgi:hypothetical protein
MSPSSRPTLAPVRASATARADRHHLRHARQGLAVGRRVLGLAHARDGVDLDFAHARHGRDRAAAVGLDFGLERAGRRRQDQREAHPAVVDRHVLDHPERDQVAMEVGVLDGAQGLQDVFLPDCGHAFS